MPHARCPVDGLRQRGTRRVDDDLADGLRAERARGLVGMLELHVDAARVQTSGQPVREQARFADGSLGRARDVLHERMPDALHDAAFHLDARERRVDRDAAIDHGGVVEHLYHAGLAVEFDLDHAHHVRWRGHRRGMLGGGLRGKAAVALAFRGDLGQRDRAPRGLVANASALEAQLGRIAAELRGGDGTQALLELRARLLHCHAGDVGGGGCVRTRVVGGRVGVGAEHAHGIHGAFHMLGDHLGQDGVATRAHVGRGDKQHVSPVVVELDSDRAHVDAGDA